MSRIATRTSELGELFSWYSFGRKPYRTSFPHRLPAQAQIGGTLGKPGQWIGAARQLPAIGSRFRQ
jgi:hypothetical protein